MLADGGTATRGGRCVCVDHAVRQLARCGEIGTGVAVTCEHGGVLAQMSP